MNDLEANQVGFTMEFYNEVQELGQRTEEQLRAEAEQRLRKLMEGHTDITGAAVALEQPANRESAYVFRARVVAYMRPENIAGVATEENPVQALKDALSAVERQVREKRDRLRKH